VSAAAIAISLHAAHAIVLQQMETTAWNVKLRTPYRHAAEVCRSVLQHAPHRWRIYRAGIAVGLPSEFQRRPRHTARATAWRRLDALGRTYVAASPAPITLRDGILRALETDEGQALLRAYRATPLDRPKPLKPARKRRATRKH
jgi:hypothetical protein